MSDLPIHAAAVRLDVGFLGVEHREALRKLLLITARTIESDAVLPTPLLAAYVAAVEVLGSDVSIGGGAR